jgi:lipopolysaccharide export system ATP-binding protein
MKHRLPKPKSSKSGHRKKRDVTQAELEINGDEAENSPSDMESYSPAEDTEEHPSDPSSPEDSETSAPSETEAERGSFSHLVKSETEEADKGSFPHLVKSDSDEDSSSATTTTDREPLVHESRPASNPEWENSLPPASLPHETEAASVLTSVNEPRRVLPPPLPFQPLPNQALHPGTGPADEHSPLLIQTHGLVKQYGGRRVVNGVDIHVRAGEVVGLLGKNGAGKTTTFYMIVGLVPPTEGHVYMGEEDVTRMPMYRRARRGIGYLPQEESIFRKLSVEENLLAILETLPLTEEERDTRCDELLRDFGLEHVRDNIAITLSGGEKRRVTIARALVTSPTLLLLDEPFSGVDPMAVHDIQEIIAHLKDRGLGVLITDHNVRETLSVVDRAYIIDEGRVLTQGSREFIINDPTAREIYLGHRFSM